MRVKFVPVLVAALIALGGCGQSGRSSEVASRAAVALGKMKAPAGTGECTTGFNGRATGMLCWAGNADIRLTARALRAELVELGAGNTAARCVARTDIVMCQVSGTLASEAVRLLVAPNQLRPKAVGVFVSGGLEGAPIPAPDLPHWTSVPL